MVAILLSFICAKISETKVLNKLISALSHKSINDNVWKDIIDYEGTTLNIFCKNKSISYCGILVAMEENGADSWLILKDYIIQYYDKDEIFDSALLPNPSTLAINLKNADRIELYYNPDTKIFK